MLNAERRLLVFNEPGITGYLQRETARQRGTCLILAHKSNDFLVSLRHTKTRSENVCLSPESIQQLHPNVHTAEIACGP